MAEISSNALKGSNYPENRRKYNGNELQSKEFGDGNGLEWFDFNARTYDQQIGRFLQIAPLVENNQESSTPYHFAFNNPVRYNDPDGKNPIVIVIIEVADAIWIGYPVHATVSTAATLLSEAMGKDGAKPHGKDVTPAAKDETAAPLAAPEKAIDEKSKPKVSPELADILEKMETVPAPNRHGGGKNGQHAHQKARDSAKDRYETAKKEYETLKSKPNKTKEDKAALDKLKRAVDQGKKKMDNTGENHSRKAKGSN